MFKGIVCIGANGVMGNNGAMPWGDKPLDGKFFREKTEGHIVVMGRKTFDSMGRKALPNRTNVVMSKSPIWDFEGAVVVSSNVKSVLRQAENRKDVDIWIIGGSEVFRQFMPYIEELYVTTVGDNFEGDTFFPNMHEDYQWYTELLDYQQVVVPRIPKNQPIARWIDTDDVLRREDYEIPIDTYTLTFRKFTKKKEVGGKWL